MNDPVNLARLEDFSDGTPGGLAGLIRLFLDDERESLAQLAAAGAAGDAPGVTLLAHRFGGTCAACGAEALADLLYNLEAAAPAAAAADIRRQIERIEQASAEVIRYLTAYLEGLPEP